MISMGVIVRKMRVLVTIGKNSIRPPQEDTTYARQ